jgi:hypothetical protein
MDTGEEGMWILGDVFMIKVGALFVRCWCDVGVLCPETE